MAINLCDFTNTDSSGLAIWQWSYGQKVILKGDNIVAGMTIQWNYPGIAGVDSRLIEQEGSDLVAFIPDLALQQKNSFIGYVYYFNAEVGDTYYAIRVDIRPRANTDEITSVDQTPAWQQFLLGAQDAIDSIEETEEDIETAEGFRVSAEEARAVWEAYDETKEDYIVGNKVYYLG